MREVRLAAVGHPAVTGRHDKTLELTAQDEITARATCVLGVAAGPLPGELPTLRGTVRLTLTAGGVTADVAGAVNPGYASAERLVVRRSDQLDPDTFLLDASAAAADLPPDLLDALRTPGAPVQVTVTETGSPPPVVLVLRPGAATAEIARLAAQADVVVDLTGRGAPAPSVPLAAPRRHGVPRGALTARTIVVLTPDLGEPVARTLAAVPGARVVVWPPSPGTDLLLAAGVPATPALHAGLLPATPTARRDLTLRLAAAAVPTVLDVPPDHGGLAELRTALPAYRLVVPDAAVGWGVGARLVAPGEEPGDLRGLRHAPRLALLPPQGPRPVTVDPAGLARLLRGAGGTGRDTAAALTSLGVPKKEAYRLAAEQS